MKNLPITQKITEVILGKECTFVFVDVEKSETYNGCAMSTKDDAGDKAYLSDLRNSPCPSCYTSTDEMQKDFCDMIRFAVIGFYFDEYKKTAKMRKNLPEGTQHNPELNCIVVHWDEINTTVNSVFAKLKIM